MCRIFFSRGDRQGRDVEEWRRCQVLREFDVLIPFTCSMSTCEEQLANGQHRTLVKFCLPEPVNLSWVVGAPRRQCQTDFSGDFPSPGSCKPELMRFVKLIVAAQLLTCFLTVCNYASNCDSAHSSSTKCTHFMGPPLSATFISMAQFQF